MRRFRDYFPANPILRHRLQKSSAYTLENLLLLMVVLLTIACAYIRFRYTIIAWGYVQHFPPAVRDEGMRRFGFAFGENGATPNPFERDAAGVQYLILILLALYAALRGAFGALLGSRRHGGLFPPELAIYPSTAAQRAVALVEWPFWKVTVILLISAFVVACTPSRRYSDYLFSMSIGYVPANVVALIIPAIIWMIGLSAMRYALRIRFRVRPLRPSVVVLAPMIIVIGTSILTMLDYAGDDIQILWWALAYLASFAIIAFDAHRRLAQLNTLPDETLKPRR